jgi:hypothetical protein
MNNKKAPFLFIILFIYLNKRKVSFHGHNKVDIIKTSKL